MTDNTDGSQLIELAAELTAAWLSNPNTKIGADELPAAIATIHGALTGLASGGAAAEPEPEYTPAVSVRRSLASRDHLISMIDGKPYKMLKRHLAQNGLTPAQYRERYGLKPDYPMVAESYAEKRRDLAKKIGLGRKPGEQPAKSAKTPAKAPAKTASRKPRAKGPARTTATAATGEG